MSDSNFADDSYRDPIPPRLIRLSERAPQDIERQALTISVQSPIDELCAALDAVEWLMSRARTIERVMKQLAIAWIDHNGEFDIGDMHYSVGFSLVTKCVQTRECGHELMRAVHGDFDLYLSVLVAQPYKHGTAKRILDKRTYNTMFLTSRAGKLIAGVPQRILKTTNKRFLPAPQEVDPTATSVEKQP